MLQCMFVLHFQDLEVLISMVIVMLLLNLACQRKSASHLCQMVCSLSNMQCNFNFAIPSVTTDKCILYSILDYIKYQSMICSLFWVNTNSAFWYMRSVLDPLPVITVFWWYWLEMIEYFLYTPSACLGQKFNYRSKFSLWIVLQGQSWKRGGVGGLDDFSSPFWISKA